MIKQLFFSLALTSTSLHSMELVLHNNDILFCITDHICLLNNGDLKETRQNVIKFSKTNKALYEYYNREKTQQNIIRQVALHNNRDDLHTASTLGYTKIRNKINCLFNKINKTENLTKDDIQDTWYRNSTATYSHLKGMDQRTLLVAAISIFEFEKAKTLITAGINCNSVRCTENPLAMMANFRCFDENDTKRTWFNIITFLLKNKIHPDSRINTNEPTLLHQAALWNDQECARLLLEYGADPYMICKKYGSHNTFELERGEPKGWFKTIVDEVKEINK